MEYEEGVEEYPCNAVGCHNPATMFCKICTQLNLEPIRYCSEKCFKQEWNTHKRLHKGVEHVSQHYMTEMQIRMDASEGKEDLVQELQALKRVSRELQNKLAKLDDNYTANVQREIDEKINEIIERRRAADHRNQCIAAANSIIREKIAIYVQYTVALGDYNKTVSTLKSKKVQILKSHFTQMSQIKDATKSAMKDYDEAIILGEEQKAKLDVFRQEMNDQALAKLASREGELEVKRSQLDMLRERIKIKEEPWLERLQELEEQCRESTEHKRQLRNIIATLRGSIRVFGRVRPYLPFDSPNSDPIVHVRPDGLSIRLVNNFAVKNFLGDDVIKQEEFSFNFDRAFGSHASQEEVYEDVGELVQAGLDGHKVCIFAYGQKKSGKTFTLLGSNDPQDDGAKGIILRAFDQIADFYEKQEEQGWRYKLQVSLYEVKEEEIKDLLNTENEDSLEMGADEAGNAYVTDLIEMDINPKFTSEIDHLLTFWEGDFTYSTVVMAITVMGLNSITNQTLKTTLTFIDLIGIENAKWKRDPTLEALSDVLTAVGYKQSVVPYRNSTLTYLLQNTLTQQGKALMLVTLSPDRASYGASLGALKFATHVSQNDTGGTKPVQDVSAELSSITAAMTTRYGGSKGKSSEWSEDLPDNYTERRTSLTTNTKASQLRTTASIDKTPARRGSTDPDAIKRRTSNIGRKIF